MGEKKVFLQVLHLHPTASERDESMGKVKEGKIESG